MTDARPHLTAIKTALNSACSATVYEYDGVPGTNGRTGSEPDQYLVVSIERRLNPVLRNDAATAVTGWRVAVRSTGLKIANVELGLAEAANALNEHRLTVDGKPTTPIQFEVAEAARWNDGRYTAVATYTYAL